MSETAAWKQPPNLLSLCVIALLAAVYFGTFSDLDYTWQIRAGEQIARTGALRITDSFTYTIAGRSLPDFEWLYELTLWTLWSQLGYGGLRLFKTLLVIAPLLVAALQLRREGIRWPGIALTMLLAVAVLAPAWNLRPLYCTTIGLLLVTGWLHEHCTGRRPLTWWLPVVMLLWSNLHPGVIMGQALLVGAIAWEWINRAVRLNRPLEPAACWRLTLIGGVGLAATFLSPDPIERLMYPFRPEVAHPIMRIFAEMQPLYTFVLRPPHLLGLVYVAAAVVGVTLVFRFREYRLWEVALLAGLAGLANLAFRSMQDWLLVMLVLGVPHLRALLTTLRERVSPATAPVAADLVHGFQLVGQALETALSRPLLRFQWFWPAAALAVLAVLSMIPAVTRRFPSPDMVQWPVAAVDWIDAHGVEGRFFGPPNYGAYLAWRQGDRAKTYVDTRGFFFPPELIEDSHFVPQFGPEWRTRLDRVLNYGTDYFLLETTGPRGRLWQSLRPRVGAPLYCDAQTVLLSARQVRSGLADVEQLACKDSGAFLQEP